MFQGICISPAEQVDTKCVMDNQTDRQPNNGEMIPMSQATFAGDLFLGQD